MDGCLFCKFVKKEVSTNIVFEDSMFLVFLDISPINEGHCLVLPKQHYDDFIALPDALARDTISLAKKVAEKLKKELRADGINIMMNNGAAAAQAIFHAHVHVVPRFKGDGHLIEETRKKVSADDLKRTQERLKKVL